MVVLRLVIGVVGCIAYASLARADGAAPGHQQRPRQAAAAQTASAKKPSVKPAAGRQRKPVHGKAGKTRGETGLASWYGGEKHGLRTASGAAFDRHEMTAAHPTLPLHSRARVTNMANGRSVTVLVTDRGPRKKGRIIDLSQSAAEQIGMKKTGIARVRVEPVAASAGRR